MQTDTLMCTSRLLAILCHFYCSTHIFKHSSVIDLYKSLAMRLNFYYLRVK